jgi:uncharacterized protein (TIGR02594 family)
VSNYTVKQGDCLSSIAYEYGLTWEKIWNDPNNAELKEKCKNQNTVYPGQVLYIPEIQEKQISSPTSQEHFFQTKNARVTLRLQIWKDYEALAREKYVLKVDNEEVGIEGHTNDRGILEHQIKADAKEATLTIIGEKNERDEYHLDLGYLDPINTSTGIQARLQNLCLYLGEISENLTSDDEKALEKALRTFQKNFKLEITGRINKETERKLEEVHDSDTIPEGMGICLNELVIGMKYLKSKYRYEFSYCVPRLSSDNELIATFNIYSTIAIFDVHMHIMSGHCTPLPLVWKQAEDEIGISVKIGRKLSDVVSDFLDLGIQEKRTDEIGLKVVKANKKTYETFQTELPEYGKYKLFTPMVVLPMDMEYAHIDGYDGKTIYQCKAGDNGYQNYDRESADKDIFYRDRKKEGKKSEETPMMSPLTDTEFDHWETQLEETIKVVVENPWKLIPMYHYEPRRWISDKKDWDKPFDCIGTANHKGLFIGFKMYTSLGYKPLDPKLGSEDPKLSSDIEKFYERCAAEPIPIMAHCTPSGMYTHEREFYLDEETDNNIAQKYNEKIKKEKVRYFNDNFVRPRAWCKVLEKYPNLKLCLAHFGGDETDYDKHPYGTDCEYDKWPCEIINLCSHYPNVYTDISYVFRDEKYRKRVKGEKIKGEEEKNEGFKGAFKEALRKNPSIKYKILFGTDWYVTNQDEWYKVVLNIVQKLSPPLSLLEIDWDQDYKNYCKDSKEFLDKTTEELKKERLLDENDDLWLLFTLINPLKYLGLDNESVVDNISNALKNNGASESEVNKNSAIIKRMGGYISGINSNLPTSIKPGAKVEQECSEMPWFKIAENEKGIKEIAGTKHNSRIIEYHKSTTLKATTDEVPWCSSFANWCMKKAGLKGTESAAARSWCKWGKKLSEPRKGCIVIFRRGNNPKAGHVAFYDHEDENYIYVLGGNQGDVVKVSPYKKGDVLDYRWPDDSN